jgi:DNA replicative helicase MCM subunit Mcm2 (Cdc46/Mcm family)
LSKAKNVTFTLPPELIEKYKYYVQKNVIPSMNAGVKEALEEYSIRMDKEMLKSEMLKASNDPLFMKDLEVSMNAFESIDEETVKGDPEW